MRKATSLQPLHFPQQTCQLFILENSSWQQEI